MITVLIPTFNRKARLERTLDAFERQSNKDFKIIISDNASEYDVCDLLDNRSEGFRNRVVVSKNPVNVGLGGNIALSLLKCETDWAWLVSDDDIIDKDAIQMIYNAIERHPDCAWIGFEIYQHGEKEKIFNSLSDYIEYLYESRKQYHYLTTADLIFMSNKVFHMDIVRKYIPYAVEFAFSYIPHVFVLYKALDDNNKAILRNDRIVCYDAPSQQDPKYSVKIAYSRMRSIVDCDFKLSEDIKKKLYAVTTPDYKNLLSVSILAPYREGDRMLFNLYYDCLRYYYSVTERMMFKICTIIDSTESGHLFLNKLLKRHNENKHE